MGGCVNEEKKLRSKLNCNMGMGYNTAGSFSRKILERRDFGIFFN
jgi:hypothetical protein